MAPHNRNDAAFEALHKEIRERAAELGERRGLPEEVVHQVLDSVTDPGKFADLGPRTRKRVVEGILQVNVAIRSAAEAHGAVIMEFSQHPGVGDRANVGSDGFHPSTLGHRRAAAEVLEALARDGTDRRACA